MKEQSETFDVLFSLFFHTDETVDLLGEKSAFPLRLFQDFTSHRTISVATLVYKFRGRETWIETFVVSDLIVCSSARYRRGALPLPHSLVH